MARDVTERVEKERAARQSSWPPAIGSFPQPFRTLMRASESR